MFFDLDGDGSAELVSWTRLESDDAFLAMDRNGNGRIDDGSELFGNYTPMYPAGRAYHRIERVRGAQVSRDSGIRSFGAQ